MDDVSHKLREKLLNQLSLDIRQDAQCKIYQKKLTASKLSERECAHYIKKIAELAAAAAVKKVNTETLPDGLLYWNIAEDVLIPFFESIYERVNIIAAKTIEAEDKKAGIGVMVTKPDFPEDRVRSLLNMWVNKSMEQKNEKSQC